MNVTELRHTALFDHLSTREFEQVSMSMNITEKDFVKDEVILQAGGMTNSLCLVLEGSISIESTDLWGNTATIYRLGEGEFFGETYALLKNEPLLADIRAAEDCRILFIGIGSLTDITNLSTGQVKLLKNLLIISNKKNLDLSLRSYHTSPKTARGRIMAYLNSVAIKKGKKAFDIPFDRQQMADYLNLDRTALSKELGNMKREGIIEFRKNRFTIKAHG